MTKLFAINVRVNVLFPKIIAPTTDDAIAIAKHRCASLLAGELPTASEIDGCVTNIFPQKPLTAKPAAIG